MNAGTGEGPSETYSDDEARQTARRRFPRRGCAAAGWQSERPHLVSTPPTSGGPGSYTFGRHPMSSSFGRWARVLALAGGIATVMALPAFAGTPFMPANDGSTARVA